MNIEAFYNNDVIYATGMTLLHSIWQIIIVFLIVHFSGRIFRNQSAFSKYLLTYSSLILILGLGIFTFIFHYYHAPALFTQSDSQGSGIRETIIIIPESSGSNSKAILDSKIYWKLNNLFPYLSIFYIAGILITGIRFASGMYMLHRYRKRKNLHPIPEAIVELFDQMVRKFKIKRIAELMESYFAKTPMVIGYLKPVIIFPAGFFTQVPYDQVEIILLHELAHIRRNDYLLNIIQSLVEILFFYHPLIYFLSSRISEERENCCDDFALAHSGDPVLLAKALAHVEESRMYPAVALTGRKKGLKERIKRILSHGRMKTKTSDRFFAGIVILAGVFILLLSSAAALSDFGLWLGPQRNNESGLRVNLPPNPDLPDTSKKVTTAVIISRKQVPDSTTREFRLKIKDGTLSELRVDGKNVRGDEFDRYAGIILEILEDIRSDKYGISKSEIEKSFRDNITEIQKQREELKIHLEELSKGIDSLDLNKIHANIFEQPDKADPDNLQGDLQMLQKELNQEIIKIQIDKRKFGLYDFGPDSLHSIIRLKTESGDLKELEQLLEDIHIQMKINSDSIQEKVNDLILEPEINRKLRDTADSAEAPVRSGINGPVMY